MSVGQAPYGSPRRRRRQHGAYAGMGQDPSLRDEDMQAQRFSEKGDKWRRSARWR